MTPSGCTLCEARVCLLPRRWGYTCRGCLWALAGLAWAVSVVADLEAGAFDGDGYTGDDTDDEDCDDGPALVGERAALYAQLGEIRVDTPEGAAAFDVALALYQQLTDAPGAGERSAPDRDGVDNDCDDGCTAWEAMALAALAHDAPEVSPGAAALQLTLEPPVASARRQRPTAAPGRRDEDSRGEQLSLLGAV